MTNQLTRAIIENIVDKCTVYKRDDTCNMHIGNREANMIRNIIHKENNKNFKVEGVIKKQSYNQVKHITLDEFIRKNIGDGEVENRLSNKEIKDSYINRFNKVSLEEIAPKISLTSIGKKG